jgi:hypothetical protein
LEGGGIGNTDYLQYLHQLNKQPNTAAICLGVTSFLQALKLAFGTQMSIIIIGILDLLSVSKLRQKQSFVTPEKLARWK